MKKKILAKLMKELKASKKLKKQVKLLKKLIKDLTKDNVQHNEDYASLLLASKAQQRVLEEIKQLVTTGTKKSVREKYITVYTDASFAPEAKAAGYGIVTVDDYGNVNEYTDKIKPAQMIDVVGAIGNNEAEAYAILKAVDIVRGLGYENIYIYTDSIVARDWSDMGCKHKSISGQYLYEKMRKLQEKLKITLCWKKRCSCEYLDKADKLARTTMRKYREEKLAVSANIDLSKQRKMVSLGELCDFSKLNLVG